MNILHDSRTAPVLGVGAMVLAKAVPRTVQTVKLYLEGNNDVEGLKKIEKFLDDAETTTGLFQFRDNDKNKEEYEEKISIDLQRVPMRLIRLFFAARRLQQISVSDSADNDSIKKLNNQEDEMMKEFMPFPSS